MFRTITAAVALLLRPAKAPQRNRGFANPLARVRSGGLTLDPRPGR